MKSMAHEDPALETKSTQMLFYTIFRHLDFRALVSVHSLPSYGAQIGGDKIRLITSADAKYSARGKKILK